MKRCTCLILGVTAALIWAVLAAPGGSTPPAEPASKELQELLRGLGSQSFTERERASKLLRQRKDAVPQLEKLLTHPDAEVQQRARRLLDHHLSADLQQPLRKLMALQEKVPIDLLVDTMVYHHDRVDEKAWLFLQNLARSLGSKIQTPRKNPELDTWLTSDFMRFQVSTANRYEYPYSSNSLRMLANQIAVGESFNGSLIVCRESMTLRQGNCLSAIVLANGDVTVTPNDIWCDIEDTLIVCDGNLHCGSIIDSVVLATGSVKSRKCQRSTVVEHAKGFERYFQLFQLQDVGLEAQPGTRGWTIKSVAQASAFAHAGLQPDDVIVGINNRPKSTVTRLRQAVRACIAEGAPLFLQVERGTTRLEVNVPFIP